MNKYKSCYYKVIRVRGDVRYYVAESYTSPFHAIWWQGKFIDNEKDCIAYIDSITTVKTIGENCDE